MACILREWLADDEPSLRLCCFDDERERFLEVAPSVLRRLLDRETALLSRAAAAGEEATPPADPLETPVRRPGLLGRSLRRGLACLPQDVRPAAGDFAYAVAHAGKCGLRLGKRVLGAAAGRLRPRPAPEPCYEAPPEPNAGLRPHDVLLSPGGSWEAGAYCKVAGQLRQAGLRLVPLVYDVIPWRLPHFFEPTFAPLFTSWLTEWFGISDRIVTISENSRLDLLAFAREHRTRVPPIDVIRLGDTDAARPAATVPPALAQLSPPKPFVLVVGTLEVRKNHQTLYQLWRRLLQERGAGLPRLVLAGQPGWMSNELLIQLLHDPLVRDEVVHLPAATDREMYWLYENCLFTLYPSHYEGWGLPVAESLARGKLCIASNTSSLPEVGGDLIDYHDPLDLFGLKELVTRALNDDYRGRRETEIRRRYRPTPWADCARSVLALFRQGATPVCGEQCRRRRLWLIDRGRSATAGAAPPACTHSPRSTCSAASAARWSPRSV